MSNTPGEKAKLLNVADTLLAEAPRLVPTHSIELAIGKSPKAGNLAGAVTVFKSSYLDMGSQLGEEITKEELLQMEQQVAETTQVAFIGPEYWSLPVNGKGLEWATRRCIELFDQFGEDAYLTIVCAELKVYERVSKAKVRRLRNDHRRLFETARKIVRLLEEGYAFDPWGQVIRRGPPRIIR